MKKLKQSTALLLIALMLVAGFAFANRTENISIVYDNIQLMIKGKSVVPKDANGNIAQPFIYNGTTYLPVRAIGEALDLEVSWDGNTKTISLNEKTPPAPKQAQYLLDLMMPYEYSAFEIPAISYTVDGSTYKRGYRIGWVGNFGSNNRGASHFKLDKKYTNFSGALCHDIDHEHSDHDEKIEVTIKGDGKLLYTTTLAEDQQVTFDIDVTDVEELKIYSEYRVFVGDPMLK